MAGAKFREAHVNKRAEYYQDDMLDELLRELERMEIVVFYWLKGHSGAVASEMADLQATRTCSRRRQCMRAIARSGGMPASPLHSTDDRFGGRLSESLDTYASGYSAGRLDRCGARRQRLDVGGDVDPKEAEYDLDTWVEPIDHEAAVAAEGSRGRRERGGGGGGQGDGGGRAGAEDAVSLQKAWARRTAEAEAGGPRRAAETRALVRRGLARPISSAGWCGRLRRASA